MINVMSTGTGWSAADLAAIGMTAEELKAEHEKAAERLKAKREQAKTDANELQANRELFQSKLTLWLPESKGDRDCPTCSTWQTPQNPVAIERANTIDGLLELYEMNALAQKLGSWALETLGWKQKVLLPLLDDFCQRHRYGGSPVLPAYSARQLNDRPKLLLCIQLMKDWKIDRLPAWLVEEMAYSIYGQDDFYTATLTTGINNKSNNNDRGNLIVAVIKEVRSRTNVDSNTTYSERMQRAEDAQNLDARKIHEKVKKAKDRLTPPDRLRASECQADHPEGQGCSPWHNLEQVVTLESAACDLNELIKLGDLFLLKVEIQDACKHLGAALP